VIIKQLGANKAPNCIYIKNKFGKCKNSPYLYNTKHNNMIYINIKNEEVTLTENELKVVECIQRYLNDGNELVYSSDIEYSIGLDMKKTRGVLSSLIKKYMIDVDKKEGGLISKFWETK
jgi:regulator of PEP synthase PpsR (kinase-PPPase family)